MTTNLEPGILSAVATLRKPGICRLKKFSRKGTAIVLASILSFMTGIVCAGEALPGAAEREWLILVYVSGVNDRGICGFGKDMINQLESVGSSSKVTVVVKYTTLGTCRDRVLQFQREAKTLLIKGDGGDPEITSPVIDTSPLTDMASEQSLSLFIRKNAAKYPSMRVMLVLWGKGMGFRGALDDDVSRDRMTIPEMASTLSQAREATHRKVDVLAIDADLMQMAEVIYERLTK